MSYDDLSQITPALSNIANNTGSDIGSSMSCEACVGTEIGANQALMSDQGS